MKPPVTRVCILCRIVNKKTVNVGITIKTNLLPLSMRNPVSNSKKKSKLTKEIPNVKKKNLITFKSKAGSLRISARIRSSITGTKMIPSGAVKTPPIDAKAVFSNGNNTQSK